MKLATIQDRPAIIDFMASKAPYMMFPWSNLLRHGMGDDHPRAMTFWHAGGITDLLGITAEGMIMPFCPNTADNVAPLLKGRSVLGLLGESDHVARIKVCLGLNPADLDETEPHYDLPLTRLIVPETRGLTLHPLAYAPTELMVSWRAAYAVETLSISEADAHAKAQEDITGYIAQDSHRVLYANDRPVAICGFNATAPGVVQIGGVYTPPSLRGRGYARAAVALHLVQARARGVSRAILFAANEAAERAYQAIGFRKIGHFTVAIYDSPQNV